MTAVGKRDRLDEAVGGLSGGEENMMAQGRNGFHTAVSRGDEECGFLRVDRGRGCGSEERGRRWDSGDLVEVGGGRCEREERFSAC